MNSIRETINLKQFFFSSTMSIFLTLDDKRKSLDFIINQVTKRQMNIFYAQFYVIVFQAYKGFICHRKSFQQY